jgi:hypothetical protein
VSILSYSTRRWGLPKDLKKLWSGSMLIRWHKRAAAAVFDLLGEAAILRHVFSFLPGNWLFLGAVCREWQAVYASQAYQSVYSISLYGTGKR